MIILIASHHDKIAEALVTRWRAHDARLLTCEDLSMVGWRDYQSASKASTAVVGGQEVTLKEISAVLIRLPGIWEQELLHIVPIDRAYVAMEMTSFLVFWLSRLKCPVLNRPTPASLSGPNWRLEQWTYIAARIGIPVRPVRRCIARETKGFPEDPKETPFTVTVVGDRCLGTVDESLTIQARQLADAAKVDLLAVQFSGPEPGSLFVSAHVWPDFAIDEVADAVIDYFQQRRIG